MEDDERLFEGFVEENTPKSTHTKSRDDSASKNRVRPILSLFACNTLYVLSIKSGITLAVPNYNNSNVLSRSSSAKFC